MRYNISSQIIKMILLAVSLTVVPVGFAQQDAGIPVEVPEATDVAVEVASGNAVYGEVTHGSLRISKDGKTLELPLKHTDVDARITGYIARVDVVQHYTNPYQEAIEAVYVFPLLHNSAVDAMDMKIGDRIITGVMKRREQARQMYEQAIDEGKTASLLEQERPNIFTQSVGNIMPGDEIEIHISYVQDLSYDHGTYEFRFPMVVGPRFIPGAPLGQEQVAGFQSVGQPVQPQAGGGWAYDTDRVPDASRITPSVIKPEFRSGHDINLTLTVEAGVPVQNFTCPSHNVVQKEISESSVEVSIKAGDRIPNKDFVFRYDVAGDEPAYALLTHARGAGDGYFMLMIQPQAEFKIEDITPREIFFVVDCSGSMSGFPIRKVKEAMRMAIENLHPEDRFQIIKFSKDAHRFAKSPVRASGTNIARALRYVDNMEGNGGTYMLKGVKEALRYPRNPKRRRFVLFMTDGEIGNERDILAEVEEQAGDARIFTFGASAAPNTYLLEKMAELGHGHCTYCRWNEDPQASIQLFYERIAKPFLLDIEVDFGEIAVEDIYPEKIPDVFSDQPIIIHGRYTSPGDAVIKLKGHVRNKPYIQEIPATFPEHQPEHDVLAKLWARTRIERYTEEMLDYEDPEIVAKVVDIALRFNIITDYTSFVAVSKEVRNETGKMDKFQVPVPIPEDVSYEGVFGDDDAQVIISEVEVSDTLIRELITRDPDEGKWYGKNGIDRRSGEDLGVFLAAKPGVSQTGGLSDGLHLQGGKANEALYVVDGINASDPVYMPEVTVRGEMTCNSFESNEVHCCMAMSVVREPVGVAVGPIAGAHFIGRHDCDDLSYIITRGGYTYYYGGYYSDSRNKQISCEVGFSEPVILGSLDESEVCKLLESLESELKGYYEHFLRWRSFSGRVVLEITVKPDGKVKEVMTKSGNLGHKSMKKVMIHSIRKTRFPSTGDGGNAIITVPVIFSKLR